MPGLKESYLDFDTSSEASAEEDLVRKDLEKLSVEDLNERLEKLPEGSVNYQIVKKTIEDKRAKERSEGIDDFELNDIMGIQRIGRGISAKEMEIVLSWIFKDKKQYKVIEGRAVSGDQEGNERMGHESYEYNIIDGFNILKNIRMLIPNIDVGRVGEEGGAFLENSARIFIADPYRSDNFIESFNDDINRVIKGVGDSSVGRWSEMPKRIIIPVLHTIGDISDILNMEGLHWTAVIIDIDYEKESVIVMDDDPFGNSRFVGRERGIKESIQRNVSELIARSKGIQVCQISSIEYVSKKVDQQGKGQKNKNCGPITYSNIKDYIFRKK